MDLVLGHLQQYTREYVILGVCTLPILFVTRKYSVPVILYFVEYCIYLFCVHALLYAVLNLARWFKENSSMRALRSDGKPVDAPTWKMPFMEFWDTHAYDPQWMWKIEILIAVFIFIGMWKYRPMKVQSKRVRRFNDTGKKRTDFSKYNPKNRPAAK